MPSPPHEVLVELFRNCGALAPELLRSCAGVSLSHAHTVIASSDLSQLVSTEYRADAVIELRDLHNAVVGAVIVEVQLGADPDKQYSWPVYVAALRGRLRCPVVLLVIAPQRAVARWARQPIETGHPGFRMVPVTLSFQDLPKLTDASQAHHVPELAVLSALAHPELDVALAAAEAIAALPDDPKRLYLDVILAKLSKGIRQAVKERLLMIKGYQYQSEFARSYVSQGREEGRFEGREEGLREAVLGLARLRLATVTAADEAAIAAVHGVDALNGLLTALASGGPARARRAFDRALQAHAE